MDIRLAVASDVDRVLALWQAAGARPSTTDDEVAVARIAGQGSLLLAVDETGNVHGTLIAAFDGWRGNMYRLVVAHGSRRVGTARALVEAGEERLAAQGCHRITALVVSAEPGAAAFWRAVGYAHDHRMLRYVKTVADHSE